MLNIQKDIPLKDYTTLKIGGPAKFFIEVASEEDLKEAITHAVDTDNPYLIIGAGSDLLVSDSGFAGLVIKCNLQGIQIVENNLIVSSGMPLQDLVDFANKNGLSGLEKLAGIPGTVGGAIYGNAGAYGQAISDHLVNVKVYDGENEILISKNECGFEYRKSIFKDKKLLVILGAEFKLEPGNSQTLTNLSKETIELRSKKYPAGIKCPGSFFKNVVTGNLPVEILVNIPEDKIIYGKIPSGYLMEAVGANGARKGDVEVASYHGNLLLNVGDAKASDFFKLAKEYKQKVKEKFGIELEPEVQLVGFKEEL